MFELNNSDVEVEEFLGSKIFYIDNFYKNPDQIVQFFLSIKPKFHKEWQDGYSYNKIYFRDMRHEIPVDISHVYDYLSDLCGQTYEDKFVETNCMNFEPSVFNDYENCYWWPHLDIGYTALIYFNPDDEECGTNLYECTNKVPGCEADSKDNVREHFAPWRSKENYELLKSLKPRYNRCILFDAKKFLHGQNIIDDRYFGENFRLNQVLFFKPYD